MVPYYQHPLVKIYRGSCHYFSKYKKYRCDAVVMRWLYTGGIVVIQWWGYAATMINLAADNGQRGAQRAETVHYSCNFTMLYHYSLVIVECLAYDAA